MKPLFRVDNKLMDIDQIVDKYLISKGITDPEEPLLESDCIPAWLELPDSLGG